MSIKSTSLAILALAACAVAQPALAREPGTPAAMPSGTTMGTPVGANFPQPGFYLTNRNVFVENEVYDGNGDPTGLTLSAKAIATQIHWTPGFELWGGTYRAMATLAYQDLKLGAGGATIGENTSFSDVVISPLNVHWMVSPGVFVNSGVSLSVPLGDFEAGSPTPAGGQNAPVLALDAGISYLRDGWNLSAHASYFIHGKNKDTDYTSGDELLINWTAMKAIGSDGWSAGLVGYHRSQVSSDKNDGAAYGGTIAGKVKETGAGIAVTKQLGPVTLQADYTWNLSAENTAAGDAFRFNVTLPLGGKK